MKVEMTPEAVLLLAVIGGAGLYVWKKGGLGKAAVSAAGAVATGTIDAVSVGVGLPTTSDTTTDPAVARWLIDNFGYFEASKWSGVPALVSGALMAGGTGTAPSADSPAGRHFLGLVLPTASYDETDRLLKRYPAPPINYELTGYLPGSYGLGA